MTRNVDVSAGSRTTGAVTNIQNLWPAGSFGHVWFWRPA